MTDRDAGYREGIEAMREACAKIAERDTRSSLAKEHHYQPDWYLHGLSIAAEIRALTLPSTPDDALTPSAVADAGGAAKSDGDTVNLPAVTRQCDGGVTCREWKSYPSDNTRETMPDFPCFDGLSSSNASAGERAGKSPAPSSTPDDGKAEPVAYLRDISGTDEYEDLAVCIKGDPGAFPVFTTSPASDGAIREALTDISELIAAVRDGRFYDHYDAATMLLGKASKAVTALSAHAGDAIPSLSWWEAASLHAEYSASIGEWVVTFKSPRGDEWRKVGIGQRAIAPGNAHAGGAAKSGGVLAELVEMPDKQFFKTIMEERPGPSDTHAEVKG
jgi:hypothetical protein